MKKLTFLLVIIFISSIASAQVKENRDVKDFSGVSFGVAGELYLVQGNKFSVSIEGSKSLLSEVETYVKDGKLIIRKKNWNSFRTDKVTVWVTKPEIDDLSVSGSGTIKAEGPVSGKEFELHVSGSGKLMLSSLEADELDCSISGSGTIYLDEGSANECDLSISGSGDYMGKDFEISEMDVTVSGSGKCVCNVSKQLGARVSGSGDIYYSGSASVDARISGSGKVRKN